MAKVSDFVRTWCAEVMWREILPRSLDRESRVIVRCAASCFHFQFAHSLRSEEGLRALSL